jgi:hypothetical protein
MGRSAGLLGGIWDIAVATLLLGAVVGVVLWQHELESLWRRVRRRLSPPPEPPTSLAIERIARDARRLRRELRTLGAGTPMARRVGISRAYDDVLVDACHALGVPDTLSELEPGIERESERLRVEQELEAVGLSLGA